LDIQELKDYIVDNDKIQEILASLSCGHIKDHKNYITASRPNGDNPNSIVVYRDDLSVKQYTGECISGDLVALVMGLKNIDFISALKWLHKELNLQWNNKKIKDSSKPKFDPLSVFTSKLKSKRKCNVDDIEIYDEDILTDFGDCIHKDYCNNRITEKIRREFGLCYDYKRQRTVVPWRNQNGIVGLSGRTSIPLYRELEIPKFWSYQGFQKSKCLYGFCENYAHIQKAGYVMIYEAEKSVLIRASLNDRTGVAIGSNNITDEQVRLILSLNCDVVVALDKDQSLEHIKDMCDKFSKYRTTYYIWDKWNLLNEKDSPADADNKTFNFLLKYKFKYTNDKDKAERVLTY
jgi:DNA primase